MTEIHPVLVGRVAATHVIPSFEYAALDEPFATVTKRPVLGLFATALQFAVDGRVAAVHANPSFEYAAVVEVLTTTNL